MCETATNNESKDERAHIVPMFWVWERSRAASISSRMYLDNMRQLFEFRVARAISLHGSWLEEQKSQDERQR